MDNEMINMIDQMNAMTDAEEQQLLLQKAFTRFEIFKFLVALRNGSEFNVPEMLATAEEVYEWVMEV